MSVILPSTWEAEVGGFVSSKLSWAVQKSYLKNQQTNHPKEIEVT
jgi:hypothetical protein